MKLVSFFIYKQWYIHAYTNTYKDHLNPNGYMENKHDFNA